MQNLLDPAILFFAFGVLAGTLKSNLEIPQPIARFLSLYLLMALGLKGGFALAHSGMTANVAISLMAAVSLAVAIPILGYQVLRRLLPGFDAAAVAATYGSVSAVTFVTAVQFLETQHIAYGGHMAAALALMESPAIILAVVLANTLRQGQATGAVQMHGDGTASVGQAKRMPMGKILHESFTDGAQLLLLGAMLAVQTMALYRQLSRAVVAVAVLAVLVVLAAVARSLRVMLRAASAAGSAWMRTAGRWPPDSVAGSASAKPGSSRSASACATAASRCARGPGGTANSRFSRTVM